MAATDHKYELHNFSLRVLRDDISLSAPAEYLTGKGSNHFM